MKPVCVCEESVSTEIYNKVASVCPIRTLRCYIFGKAAASPPRWVCVCVMCKYQSIFVDRDCLCG